jgi:capsular exopolysaccharide synthesis family protein
MTLGASFGFTLGIGLVILLHFLDRTVKTPEELERLLDLPVLGVIPDMSDNSRAYSYRSYYGQGKGQTTEGTGERPTNIELLPALKPRLAVSEAYRSIRTALLLSTAEKLRAITITSAESGEGKTATAANLALVMAQLGRRVLLIDADLRKPRVHKVFKASNRDGLVSYLTLQLDFDSTTQETQHENLWICPSGPHPPNPSELLASERMREFLHAASVKFDFVIVDSPPVLPVTDGVLIGSIVDGVVLCLRANKVHREDAKSCRERLRMADVKVLGTILNRYSPGRTGSYGRRYHYYESYAAQTDNEISGSAA